MFGTQTYVQRRKKLLSQVESGLLLFLGNNDVGMNYKGNTYHFRQDSNFLYFFGIDQAGLTAVIDLDEGTETIFGNDLSLDDIVWMGPQPTLAELGSKVGVKSVKPANDLGDIVAKAKADGRKVHYLPPYRYDNMFKLNGMLDIPVGDLKQNASEDFIKAVVAQRSYKSAEEIVEIEKAVKTSGAMHIAAMRSAKEGQTEANLAGIVEGISVSMGGGLSYPVILTINGQTLHNHYHGNTLTKGKLVLGDFGAETAMHYAGDLTRTFPVDKKFTQKQKDIYEIVLKAEVDSIAALKPGIPYQQVHLNAAKILAEGLKSLGLMKGDIDEAVAQGAHAMFFPHGLGHMMGLDVHDMEDLGEDYIGYSDTIKRSNQFGTAYLRLGRELEAGFVLTVEPGIYFIPELIDQWKADGKFKDFINYDKVEAYRDFGGARVEDDVLITESGHRILADGVPKSVADVEAMREG